METYFDIIPYELISIIISYLKTIKDVENFDLAINSDNEIYRQLVYQEFPKSLYIWKKILSDFPEFTWKDIHLVAPTALPDFRLKDESLVKLDIIQTDNLDSIISHHPSYNEFYLCDKVHDKILKLEKILLIKINYPENLYNLIKEHPNKIHEIYNFSFFYNYREQHSWCNKHSKINMYNLIIEFKDKITLDILKKLVIIFGFDPEKFTLTKKRYFLKF